MRVYGKVATKYDGLRLSCALTVTFSLNRSEYPPLASRVLTSSGVAALLKTPRRVCSRWSTGPPSSEGLGEDPKHRGAIRPKPQCKLSRMSQLLTIYTNPPATSNLVCATSSLMRRAAWAAAKAHAAAAPRPLSIVGSSRVEHGLRRRLASHARTVAGLSPAVARRG